MEKENPSDDGQNPDRRWYALHTYSGYEAAVARNLKHRIESLGMEDKIFNVIVPTEKKIRLRGGKRRGLGDIRDQDHGVPAHHGGRREIGGLFGYQHTHCTLLD